MSSFHRVDWLAIVSPIVTLLIVAGGYYIAYFQEKGKSRATGEDIDKLTRIVDGIKTENATRLAGIAHQNAVLIEQLKVASTTPGSGDRQAPTSSPGSFSALAQDLQTYPRGRHRFSG